MHPLGSSMNTTFQSVSVYQFSLGALLGWFTLFIYILMSSVPASCSLFDQKEVWANRGLSLYRNVPEVAMQRIKQRAEKNAQNT